MEQRRTALDREIVLERLIEAPRRFVFEAFTKPEHLSNWWGPDGFTTTTTAFDFRAGGEWIFTMHGPDGTDYPNWMRWEEIVPPERIVATHGDRPDDPEAFTSVFTFSEEAGATRITLRTIFPSVEARERAVSEYHAVEGGQQTLGRLAAFAIGLSKEV
jgi:uncharacterized protein YndB with AHSA1/START domain